MKFFDHGDYLNFGFKRFGNFNYLVTNNNYINTAVNANFIWEFNQKNQTIIVYIDNEIFFKLKPISKKQIKIESRYVCQKGLLITNELTLIKIK